MFRYRILGSQYEIFKKDLRMKELRPILKTHFNLSGGLGYG